MENVRGFEELIKWKECDITDAHSVSEIIKEIKPDIIHHLAAMSFVPASWKYPARTMEVNLIGTINLFEAIREFSPKTVIQVASSSETYGIPKSLPITEKHILQPCSPYGVSKAAMDLAAQQYYKSYKLSIIITRAFNHSGKRRGSEFVCSSFAKQIAEIELLNKEPIIKVGNLSSLRDFTDVRDMCDAYLLAVKMCNPGEPYNISSNFSVSIQNVLDMLINMSPLKITTIIDITRLRPSDLDKLEGDSNNFRRLTGWTNKITLENTMKDLLNYWREKIRHGNETISSS